MGITNIEWTDRSWNCVRGCSRVSQGCVNCYAERQAARFSGPGRPFDGFIRIQTGGGPQWTGKVQLVEEHLTDPLHWRKPQKVFVNSMSDLFHEALPDEAIDRVFAVMALSAQHTFQILTKRPERMLKYFGSFFHPNAEKRGWDCAEWMISVGLGQDAGQRVIESRFWDGLPNVWLGISCEDQKTADERIPLLLQTPAAIRFVSYEPALGPVDFQNHPMFWNGSATLDWVIVGGESGPGARPFDIQWARNTVQQCKAAGVACFMKQLGARPVSGLKREQEINSIVSVTRGSNVILKDRKGGDMSEWPEDLRVREFPR